MSHEINTHKKTEKEGKRERGKEGKRERGKEGKRERGKEGKRERGEREKERKKRVSLGWKGLPWTNTLAYRAN